MRYERLTVTPALAEQFLKQNVCNRKHIRKTWVKSLAQEMKQGTFRTTHQGLAFNRAGGLLDGQHRLLAVVESGCTVEMWVAFDCEADHAMEWPVDRGAGRSAADVMGVSPIEAAMVDAILRIYAKEARRFTTLERKTTWELFQVHFATLFGRCNTARKTNSRIAVRVPALLRMIIHGEEVADQYRYFVLQDYSNMWPSVQALTRQLTVATMMKKESESALMARVWIALNPARMASSKIQVNDHTIQLGEMRKYLETLGLNGALKSAGCLTAVVPVSATQGK